MLNSNGRKRACTETFARHDDSGRRHGGGGGAPAVSGGPGAGAPGSGPSEAVTPLARSKNRERLPKRDRSTPNGPRSGRGALINQRCAALGSACPSTNCVLMSLTGFVVLLVIVAAFGVLGAAVFWLALKDEDNRGRQDCVKWSKSPVSYASPAPSRRPGRSTRPARASASATPTGRCSPSSISSTDIAARAKTTAGKHPMPS